MKNNHLAAAFSWCILAAVWLVYVLVGVHYQAKTGVLILRGVCSLLCLAAAIMSFLKHRETKKGSR